MSGESSTGPKVCQRKEFRLSEQGGETTSGCPAGPLLVTICSRAVMARVPPGAACLVSYLSVPGKDVLLPDPRTDPLVREARRFARDPIPMG